MLKRLSIKTKLVLMLFLVSLSAAAVIGYLSWSYNRKELKETVFQHLASVRDAKARQLESLFHDFMNQIALLGAEDTIAGAMVRFNKYFKDLEFEVIPNDWDETTDLYYKEEFLPKLAPHVFGEPTIDLYKPDSTAAHYLQYWYITNNEYPEGEKYLLENAGDDSEYTEWHERYYYVFENILKRFGYGDIFLIDFEDGNIVYSFHKSVDYATNLLAGPYAKSGLAEVVQKVRRNPDSGAVQVVDFAPYAPLYQVPMAFLATAIYNGPHIVGILAVQLPVDKINQVMTGNQNWVADGLGASGETFLVGPDFRLRSVARALIEKPDDYIETLRQINMPQNSIDAVQAFGTSILYHRVETEAIRLGLSGEKGLQVIDGSAPVLSAYGPLRIEGLNWAIVTQMDLQEVLLPVARMQYFLLQTAAVLALIVMILATALSYFFARPMRRLIAGIERVIDGHEDTVIDLRAQDEFGRLASSINTITERLRTHSALVGQQHRENEALLLNIIPKAAADRMRRGDDHIADRVQQMSLLYARLVGFSQLDAQKEAAAVAAILHVLVKQFDEAADRHGMETLSVVGEHYMAACGLTVKHLNHAARTVDFGLDMLDIMARVNSEYKTALSLRIGVATGAVTAAVIGSERLRYSVWGEAVNTASRLSAVASSNVILSSQSVYDLLEGTRTFVEFDKVMVEGLGQVAAWVPVETLRMSQEQIHLVQTSFAKLAPLAEAFADHFYHHLFALAPDLRQLFDPDMHVHHLKFITTLQVVLNGLDQPETLISMVRQLGHRHLEYGLSNDHYEVFGEALSLTLAQELGDDFTPAVREAWRDVFVRICSLMQDIIANDSSVHNL